MSVVNAPRGVALSGLEFGSNIPGTLNTDFFISSADTFSHFAELGFNTVRIPFLWERLQPTLYGGLNATYKGHLDTMIARAAVVGLKVILDCHNYGRRSIYSDGGITETFTGTSSLMYPFADTGSGYIVLRDYGVSYFGTFNNPVTPATGYVVSFNMKFNSQDTSFGGEGLYVRPMYMDDNNHYEFGADISSNTWYLKKRVAGTWTTLASGSKTWGTSSTYAIVIDVNQGTNGKINVSIDGTPLYTVDSINSDGALLTGKIGFYAAGVHVKLDTLVLDVDGDTTLGGNRIYCVGETEVPFSAFASLWSEIATAYASNTTVYAFDLMNEPHDMPTPTTSSNYRTTSTVTQMMQAAVTAIRDAGDVLHYCMIEFDPWSGGQNFTATFGPNPTWWINDPMNMSVLSFHYYFDNDHSGTYPIAFDTSNNTSITPNLSPIMQWAQNNHVLLHCGEYGVPNDADWMVCLTTFLDLCNLYEVWTNHWAAGDAYSSPTTLQPTGTAPDFIDRLQMSVIGLRRFLGKLYTIPGQMLSPSYHIFLQHLANDDLFEIPYTSVNYIEELNNGSQATFEFDFSTVRDEVATPYGITVKDLFTAVLSEIWIENEKGVKLWLGVVSGYKRTKDANGHYTLTIPAIDYFSLLQKRRTGANDVYTNVDPATIPWDQISASQAKTHGDLGITEGATVSTGLTVTQEYKRADIKQVITDLSNSHIENSFDCDIDYTKKFNLYYPAKGSLRANVVLDDNTTLADGVDIPLLLNMTNSVFARGQGINSDVAESNRNADGSVIEEYTLLEDVITDTQTSDTTVLDGEGDKHLALYQLPLARITKKHGDDIDVTIYGVGDTIIVNCPEEDISYEEYRVKKRTVDIDKTGTLIATLDLLAI